MLDILVPIYSYGVVLMFIIESIHMGYKKFELDVSDVVMTAIFWPALLIGLIGLLIRWIEERNG